MLEQFQEIGRGILGNSTSDAENHAFAPIPKLYALYESYYLNRMYERSGTFADPWSGLPVTIRPIHNPTRRVVDWYAGRVYPGSMTADGLPTVSGRPNRLPYEGDTDEAVRIAVQQAFLWGAQGFDIGLYVRTGATLGDVFAEVVSDPERQKVYPRLIHPRHVTDIEWNDTGDVTRYQIEIEIEGPNNTRYTWGKIVTKDTITTLKDGRPHAYEGQPQTVPNPWGFVPGIWVQHRNVGGQHGDPAIAGVMSKVNELNGIVSEINDYILKFTKQKIIVGTDDVKGFMEALVGANATTPRFGDPAITEAYAQQRRSKLDIAAGKGPITGMRLIENMGLADSVEHRKALLEEIEQDLPEITLADKLLDMSQVTGPGAIPLVQDVQHRLDEAAANYDAGIVKLGQMCISMAAQCIRDGVWGPTLTDQQRAFAGFTPESYDRGELAFSLSSRTLIPETMDQKIARAASLERLATEAALIRSGLSAEEAREQFLQSREAADYAADTQARQFSAGSTVFG